MPEIAFSFSPGFWMLGLSWRYRTVHSLGMDGDWTVNGPQVLVPRIGMEAHRELRVIVCLVPMLPVRLVWRWAVPGEKSVATEVPR